MSKLILVRHSLPEIIPTVPARRWSLSEAGRRRCRPLADGLAAYALDVIVTSDEPKAVETGRIVASALDKPLKTAQGLHEHDRSKVAFESKEWFEAAVARFFAEPGRLVFGNETADQAHRRFSEAVARVLEEHPEQNVAIVAHGTVMTLFVARTAGLEPFPFWKRLGLPAFVVLSRPEFDVVKVVQRVDDAGSTQQ
jgi:broad specificity phosphatase PhoE